MIESLHIDGFRGLDGVDLGPLARVNVLVGPGGAGKTSLLEALFLFSGVGQPDLLRRGLLARGLDLAGRSPEDALAIMKKSFSNGSRPTSCDFKGRRHGHDVHNHLELQVNSNVTPLSNPSMPGIDLLRRAVALSIATLKMVTKLDANQFVGSLLITRNGMISNDADSPALPLATFIHHEDSAEALAPLWTALEDAGESSRVLGLLRDLDSRVQSAGVAADTRGQAYLRLAHAALGSVLPAMLGHGFTFALTLASQLAVVRGGGALFADEFDSALHIGALESVVKFLLEAARRMDVQLFLTTHRLETIDMLLDLCNPLSDLRILQVCRPGSKQRVINISGERAKELREEIGLDLRRT